MSGRPSCIHPRARLTWRAALLALLASGCASASHADIYRCVERDGSARFVDRPELCTEAQAHEPATEIQRLTAPPAAAPAPSPAFRLDDVLPSGGQVRPKWEVVDEAPTDPSADPDMVEWGVRAVRASHYTRDRAGTAEVCSIEIWQFDSEAQARAAHANFAFPDWEIVREGSLVLMTRSVRFERGGKRRREISEDCRALSLDVRTRAARVTEE